jgi:hypothetical protein
MRAVHPLIFTNVVKMYYYLSKNLIKILVFYVNNS